MFYELSVTLLYLLTLALVGVRYIWGGRHELRRRRSVQLVSVLVTWTILSLLWTPNLTRGVLTVGVTGLLYLVFLASVARASQLRAIVPALVRIYIASAVVMSLLALVQLVAGIWLEREVTLLCAGCVAEQFGFVRPNVFAIEPQFFGSLLLAPLLLLFYRLMTTRWVRYEVLAFVLVATALFLTLSRGAIFAAGLGVVLLLLVNANVWKAWARALALVAGAFVLSLGLQGVAAAANPTVAETFGGATAKVISQLSLGMIDLSMPEPTSPPSAKDAPAFDGYVEESTDVRVSRSTLALETWATDVRSVLFGVGVGGAGVAVHQKFPEQLGAREITQNEYVERLLEQGVVGLGLFAAVIAGLLYATRRDKWLWAIVAAFLFQWLFFSGYPNALHIYLFCIVTYIAVINTKRH